MFLALNTPQSRRGDAQGKIVATDETGQDPRLPPDARLDSLEQRLDRLQEAEAKRTRKAEANPVNRIWSLMFSHLVGAPVGGGVIGWGLDTLFGTFPTFFLIMLFVGFGVGVVNVMRISKTPSDGSSGAQP
jgi:ATP synthase protein I